MQFDRFDRKERRVGLTPLIDVVFLLLVFFMLASQLGQDRVLAVEVSKLNPSQSQAANPLSILRLSAAGEIVVGERRISLGAPSELLRVALAQSPDALVLVTDALASVQQITHALVDLERAGARNVSLSGGAP